MLSSHVVLFFFSSRRRHTRFDCDWSSDVCSSDLQFSLVIGLYLSALGVGAWLSRFIDRGLARAFLEVELGVALLGGLSVPLLYYRSEERRVGKECRSRWSPYH